MNKEPAAIVLTGNGTNCERETAQACRMGGFTNVDIVSVWELIAGDVTLDKYDLLCLPGGFLDGDDLGSAKAQANRFQHTVVKKTGEPLYAQITEFVKNGKLIIGICNGFQLMVKLGLLPALGGNFTQQTTLTNNDSGRFEDRWVTLSANAASPCVFTKGMDSLYLPVRHGEGKFVARDREVLDQLRAANQIVLTYVDPDTHEPTMKYPDNPNGAQLSIAGVCDPTGRLFGLMPHPEAYLHRINHPRWTRENLPEEGVGPRIFRNAFEYLKTQAT
jgi:phosphoribosylformylglycinamidine synthase subunit PurQ / glutaminase